MKKTALFLAVVLLCTLCLCACQPKEQSVGTEAVGTVTGLIDNHTVEIILEDGTVRSFLFYDDEVAEKINIAEETDTPFAFVYEQQEGQQLPVVVSAE